MNKKEIKNEIIYFIDKGLSHKSNQSYNLLKDFQDNHPDVKTDDVEDTLQEMLQSGEIVEGDDMCGKDTLIVTAFMPNTAARMAEANKKK